MKDINTFIKKNKKYFKILYHITSHKHAINILKNNFDINKSKYHAFGKGINFSDNLKHLRHYYSKNKNYVVVSLVKYNKLKYNTSYYNDINCNESMRYLKKHRFTRPLMIHPPSGYDGFINDDIYVIKSNKLIYPIFITKYDYLNMTI